MAFLLPVNVRTWLELLEDVMSCACVEALTKNLLEQCREREEFRYVCMDATVRVAMRLKGQGNYRMSAEKRAEQVVKDDEALRRVLTVRGRTGAVLMTQLVRTEGGEDVAQAFLVGVDSAIRDQVECVASDQPSSALFRSLKTACPRLKCLYLDSVHVVIVYKTTFWHKRTPGQEMLRRLQAKFQRVDAARMGASWPWGAFFTGAEDGLAYSRSEEHFRSLILDGGMAKPRAAAVLNNVQDTAPWYWITWRPWRHSVPPTVTNCLPRATAAGALCSRSCTHTRALRTWSGCGTACACDTRCLSRCSPSSGRARRRMKHCTRRSIVGSATSQKSFRRL